MAGVVVWAFKNRNLWSAYDPVVSCELERLYNNNNNTSLGARQNVNLGTISSNLSCYEVSFSQMTQTTLQSGSVREIRRSVCDTASAVGQGVVWEFEGDHPSQWMTYDLETMDVIEEGFSRRNQLSTSMIDLQQSHVHLPYIIDFQTMTQMRVETGRIRRIQRRPLIQPFTPVSSLTFGGPSMVLPSSSAYPSSLGQVGWQSIQHIGKAHSSKSKHKHQPYSINKSGVASAVNGAFHGGGGTPMTAQAGLPSQLQQLQQPPQNPGPVTRRKLQQTSGNHSGPSMYPHPQLQHPTMQQMYQSSHQPFFHQALHNIHLVGPYQHRLGQMPGQLPGFQYPPASLPQPSLATTIPQQHAHHQSSRPSSTSSLSSSPSSSMSVSSSQGSESLPSAVKVSIGKSKKTKVKTGLDVLKKFMRSAHSNLDKNDCSICVEKLSEASSYGEGKAGSHDAVELNRCGHQFHKLCLLEMYNSIHKDDSLQCPSCKTIYGEKTGTCPPGYMQWRVVHDLTLPGYEGCGAIIVSYHISSGIQSPDHPNPGQSFSARGFPRQGFLPDCDKGRKVLKLLMEAFRRRLMFTIATSNTTGETNTVTWNEIHHKTEPHGNNSGHGYPDPNYLDNVLLELAAHGVTEDCLR